MSHHPAIPPLRSAVTAAARHVVAVAPRALDALPDVHAALPPRDVPLRPRLGRASTSRLLASFAATAWAAFRGSQWLVPARGGRPGRCSSATPGSTSSPRRAAARSWEAVAEAVLAELPLAAVCAFIVYDAETFLAATTDRFRRGSATRRREVASACSSSRSRCSSCATRSSSSSSSSRVTRLSSSATRAQHAERLLREPLAAAAHAARQLGEELLDRVEDAGCCYRARPCGLERRRWRRFSRRACAAGSDGVAVTTSTSSGVGSAESACLRRLRVRPCRCRVPCRPRRHVATRGAVSSPGSASCFRRAYSGSRSFQIVSSGAAMKIEE